LSVAKPNLITYFCWVSLRQPNLQNLKSSSKTLDNQAIFHNENCWWKIATEEAEYIEKIGTLRTVPSSTAIPPFEKRSPHNLIKFPHQKGDHSSA